MASGKVEQGKTAKKRTVADIKAKKKAVTKKVTIQLDGEVADEISELRKLHLSARDSDRLDKGMDKLPEAPKILERIETLVEESRDTEVVFTFKSVGRFRYDELVLDNPPTKEQEKDGAEFNADTFPPVLVAEACASITESDGTVIEGMSLEDTVEIFSSPDWNNAELRKLFFGALEVNTETGDIPLSRDGSEGTLSSLLNLVTQQNTGSPTPSM